MAYAIVLKKSAEKQFRRLDGQPRKRVSAAIDGLAQNPEPAGSVSLTDKPPLRRVRVGDYRIVYAVDHARVRVVVTRIAHRSEVYQDLSADVSFVVDPSQLESEPLASDTPPPLRRPPPRSERNKRGRR